jgi:AcrR family transcriptional regulator
MIYYWSGSKEGLFVEVLEEIYRRFSQAEATLTYSSPAIGLIATVLESGVRKGLFRADRRARDMYLMIASMGYFHQSKRNTLSAFLGADVAAQQARCEWEDLVIKAAHAVATRTTP